MPRRAELFPDSCAVNTGALAGCAAFQNTLEQDITWNAYYQCQFEQRGAGNVRMVRVEPDGRYWWQSTDAPLGLADFEACISEKVRAQRTSSGRPFAPSR